MRLNISSRLTHDSKNFRMLDRLLDMVDSGRHDIEFDNTDTALDSAWLSTGGHRGTFNREIIEKSFVETAYRDARGAAVHIGEHTASETTLSLSDAVEWAGKPFRIIVENAGSDGAFVRKMAKILKRDAILSAESVGALVFEHAGGSGEFGRIAEAHKPDIGPPRAYILSDSDAMYPGHHSNTVKNVTEICFTLRIPGFILSKRETENYLPIEPLQQSDQRMAVAFLSLSPDQQNHFDVKFGFKTLENGAPAIPEEHGSLFADLNKATIRALCGGFGRSVGRYFKSQAPSFDTDALMHVCRTCPNEILTLLTSIEAHL